MKLNILQRTIIIVGVGALAFAVDDARSVGEIYSRMLVITVAGAALVFAFSPRTRSSRGIHLNLTQRIIIGVGTAGVVAVFIFPPTERIAVTQTGQTLKERYGDQLSTADRKKLDLSSFGIPSKRDLSAFGITNEARQSVADEIIDRRLAALTNDSLFKLGGIKPPDNVSEEVLNRTRHYYDSVNASKGQEATHRSELTRRFRRDLTKVEDDSHVNSTADYEKASLYAFAILFVTFGLTFATKSNRKAVE